VRRSGIFVGAFGKWGWLIPTDEMDLAGFADVYPKSRNAWKCGPTLIRSKTEKTLIEIKVCGQSGFIAINAYSLMMRFREL